MSASPGATPATRPELLTVATVVTDDCQVAWVVIACEVPFDIDAFAANCAELPTFGAVPVTETDVTVGAGVVVDGLAGAPVAPPHAHQPKDNTIADSKPPHMRRRIDSSQTR